MLIVKNIENNTMYSMQELNVFLCSFLLAIFTSLAVSVHFSISLSANCFLHLKFLYSSYSPTSHDLLHSHSQLVGFQINSLLHTPLSIYFYIYTYIYHHSNVVYYYKLLHLVYIYTYTFYAILFVLFH